MLCPLLYSAGWGQALSDYPLLQCRCRSRARASLRNRLPGFFVFLPLLLFQAGALVILRNVKNTGFYQCPRFRSSCLLLAQSGHPQLRCTCPLLGVKRTSRRVTLRGFSSKTWPCVAHGLHYSCLCARTPVLKMLVCPRAEGLNHHVI